MCGSLAFLELLLSNLQHCFAQQEGWRQLSEKHVKINLESDGWVIWAHSAF